MDKIVSSKEMSLADSYTIQQLKISEETLIRKASQALFEEITKRFKAGKVLIVIGKGNNGKDAEFLGKLLKNLNAFNITFFYTEKSDISLLNGGYDIVVDGIFGTGLKREVVGEYKKIIERINEIKAYKICIDIPSGINGDNGQILGIAVKGDLTIAIQEYKLGHFLNDGIDYTGELVRRNIDIVMPNTSYAYKIGIETAKSCFKKENRNTHKGTFNKCAVIGGSKNYFGALLLTTNALCAFKMGVGYSHIVFPKSLYNLYAPLIKECTISTLNDDNGNIVYDKAGLTDLLNYQTICIGMGLGVSEGVYNSVEFLLRNYTGNLIIDADALNSIAKYGVNILKGAKPNVLITPHVKEFSRLSGKSVQNILENGINLAKEFSSEYGVIVLLKNAVSIITNGSQVGINIEGTSGQAKGGSGDVLSGILTGLSARGFDLFTTAKAGSFIAGYTAKIAEAKVGSHSLLPTDVILSLNETIKNLEG